MLNRLAMSDLRELCGAHSVSTDAGKALLVERLLHVKEDNEDRVLRQRWSSVNLSELKEFCTSKGLATGGLKTEMINRVIQYHTDHPSEGGDMDSDSNPDAEEKKEQRFTLPSDNKVADRVWTYRGGVDLYTGLSRAVTREAQVDHILDVQVFDRVMADARNVSGRTRDWNLGMEEVKKVVNDVVNLNMTDRDLNQMKRDVFAAWLMDSTTNLNEYATDKGIGSRHWANIEKALPLATDGVLQALSRQADQFPKTAQVLEAYGDSLQEMIEKMRLGM
jgi:hypothetical protein